MISQDIKNRVEAVQEKIILMVEEVSSDLWVKRNESDSEEFNTQVNSLNSLMETILLTDIFINDKEY